MDEKKYSLYIISTPIGNMDDISVRALDALRECDFILCEDTRQSMKLMSRYDIHRPLVSYHKFNESKTVDAITDRLISGETACLISDAGTPLVSDPGFILTQRLIELGICFTVIPGANAVLPSIIMSGFPTEGFFFRGFLPKGASDRQKVLSETLALPFPAVIYASPHELVKLLGEIDRLSPGMPLAVNKELTKLHEETFRGTASEILKMLPETVKGEYTIVTAGAEAVKIETEEMDDEEIKRSFEKLTAEGIRGKEAVRILAEKTERPAKELYDMLMKK